MKREHWRIELRLYAWLAKPLRFLGVDLNWVFDPITQQERKAERIVAPEHQGVAAQSHREE